MDYRFYIYKQAVVSGFNKYDLTQYSLLREITNISQWDLNIDRDREFYTVIREEFSGDITVVGDDYTALKALENTHLQYAVVIHQKCNGVYSLKWKGFFTYFDFKIDQDKCMLRFEPSTWDVYTPIFDQFPVDRNILAADSNYTALMDYFEWGSESVERDYVTTGNSIGAAYWHEFTGLPAGNNYYLYSIEWTQELLSSEDGADFYTFYVHEVYKRDVGFSNSDTVPPTPDPDWTNPEEINPGLYKWSRPYLDSMFQTYTFSGGWYGVSSYILNIVSSVNITIYGLKRLSKVMEYYASFFDLTYVSNFFNDSPCPMGGNTLALTMVQQISNLSAYGEQATKGIVKLKDFLTWIRDTFNVYWHIDSNGDWRFEHRRYFDNGLSYAYTHSIELDLTGLTNKMNKYKYAKPSLKRFERLELQNSGFFDWTESKIEYPQLSILGNEEDVKSVGWGSDVVTMYDGRTELSKQGWVIYNVELIGVVYKVANTIGAISGVSMVNGRFSNANLLRDLWTWGRLLPTGNVNGVATTFDSILKLKEQEEVIYPQCCEVIDYNGLVRTELGDGMINSAKYVSKTGNLKLNLIYE